MTATGVKVSVSKEMLAKAGISMADLNWMRSVRNSAVAKTPLYQRMLGRVQALRQQAEMKALEAAMA